MPQNGETGFLVLRKFGGVVEAFEPKCVKMLSGFLDSRVCERYQHIHNCFDRTPKF